MHTTTMLIDVDGTLLDSNEAHARTWARVLHEHGYRTPIGEIRRMIGMGGDRILRHVDPSLDEDTEPGKTISRKRLLLFMNEYVTQLKPTPGARALLLRLGEMGIKRVVATSAKKDELHALLASAGVADQIDVAVTADEAAQSKPAKDIVENALARAGAAANEAIYLGDTPYDVEAARGAGVACIAVRSGGWNDAALSGAAAIYDHPADLLDNINEAPI
ncbi:MAG: HAD family hydrolase [Candidatus Eremiobacteraeota bacterium]|nr:HAD family hydrolase [Candidatus Eremiobacteraeota bacterium]